MGTNHLIKNLQFREQSYAKPLLDLQDLWYDMG